MTTIIQMNRADLREELAAIYKDMMEAARKEAARKARDILLTPDEAAEALKISAVTLWRWGKIAYLTPIWIGGKKRYKNSDIQRIIERGGLAV